MSYILDALRRADAERARGAVPGLHAQGVAPDGEPAARHVTPWLWAAGGAGVLLLAGVAILLFGPWKPAAPAPDARVALAPAPQLAPARGDAVPAPSTAPATAQGELPAAQPGGIDPGARPIEPPLARATAQPYPPPAAPPVPDAGAELARRAAAGRVATLERVPAVPVEHYGAPLPTAAASGSAVSRLADLPPDLRAQLPRLSVGGAIYSETPSARMVILNGQVFHEGDRPAADTVLEQIRLKSAILNFRGQRYEIAF